MAKSKPIDYKKLRALSHNTVLAIIRGALVEMNNNTRPSTFRSADLDLTKSPYRFGNDDFSTLASKINTGFLSLKPHKLRLGLPGGDLVDHNVKTVGDLYLAIKKHIHQGSS